MLFSSIPFIYYFLPCILIVYYLAPKSLKNFVLLVSSLIFYAWGEPKYVFIMVGSLIMSYSFGLLIEKYREKKIGKWLLVAALVISLGLLGYFKYANFVIRNINTITNSSISLLDVVLPIGISFYTFQLISYLIDVYWGKVRAQRNFISLATYITMFPQLIAGPIVRYSDIDKQLTERSITFSKISYGIRRFVIGLGKKILIANVLGEFCSQFKMIDDKSLVFFWSYAIAVSLQIYFDFSGYSDMAIGLGNMLGFKFIENFNYPFISKSITEFWRRWHMSLGTWFRDYVYIPLGGSRCKVARNLINILIVWMLTGLWHGAEWTFVAWGLYFAILLMIEKVFLMKHLNNHPVVAHVYLLLLVIVSFVIFDAGNISQALEYIGTMFGGGDVPFVTDVTLYYLRSYAFIFIIALLGATSVPKKLFEKLSGYKYTARIIEIIEPIVMILLLLVVTGYLVDGSFNPFLYFRF